MGSDDLTCREPVGLVTEYLEGSLSPPDRRRFELHLRGCRVCPRYVEQLRATVVVLGRLGEEHLKDPVKEYLIGGVSGLALDVIMSVPAKQSVKRLRAPNNRPSGKWNGKQGRSANTGGPTSFVVPVRP